MFEYSATQRSTKLVPGRIAIKTNAKKKDMRHWDVVTRTFLEAGKEGYSLQFEEEGIAYGVCHTLEQIDSLVLNLTKSWKTPVFLFGGRYEHVVGLPQIMPLTLYEIPFEMKKEILFEDIFVSGFVDLNGVCNTLTERGVEASLEGNGIRIKTRNGFVCFWH